MAKIVFWLGPTLEQWDFATALATGIGGSETAAIHLAHELVKLGHEVEVYGDFAEEKAWRVVDHVAVWGGFRTTSRDVLRAIPYHRWFPQQSCDLFISSRQPDARRHCLPYCKKAWLWVHDLHCGPDWDNLIATDYDKVLCLSDFAREQFLRYYPGTDENKVVKTSNAVDPTLFAEPGKQHLYYDRCSPWRVTYSSSPDRGLDKLLDLWSKIRELVTGELHVYYGMDNWRKAAERHGNMSDLIRIDRLTTRLAETPGVFYHDRVGQAEVARSYLRSQLWLYPTDFLETSCCHPDTMISLPGDHRVAQPYRVKISDLVGKTNFPVYTYDIDEDRFRIGTALWCAQTRVADELVELELDDGSKLRVTPDHKIMNFESEWVEAGKLEPGDRLTALHHRYQVMIKDVSGRWVEESRLVGEWIAEQKGKTLLFNQHVDHSDPLRLDNNPDNLQILDRASHFKKTHLGSIRRQHNSGARISAYKVWIGENLESVTTKLKKNGKKLWDTVNAMSPEDRRIWCEMRAYRRVVSTRLAKLFPDYKERVRRLAARHSLTGQIGNGFWVWLNSLPSELRRSIIEDTCEGKWNHRIVAVRRIPGSPVYDMEVAKYHNFVADGVVVHNCITAMEAQAAGCKIVATRCGALPETLRDAGAYLVDGPASIAGTSVPDYDERFLAAVQEALVSDEVIVPKVPTWSEVAVQWDAWIMEES